MIGGFMEYEALERLVAEINRMKVAEELLSRVYWFLSPYDKKINGKDSGNLCYEIAEFFGLDDSE